MKKIALLLSLGVFLTVSCVEKELESPVSNVKFTPCQQSNLRSSNSSSKVNVEFTDNGVQITHNDFEVTCDFSTVNVTYTFVNGFLNISQQASPNQANCICYTDVSYTINGISKNEVNVIFINGMQVYCYNDNGNGKEEDPNVKALNKFVQDHQYYFTLGYIFNEYANEDLIIAYKSYDDSNTQRGFAIIRNGVVYNTTFTIPRAGNSGNRMECMWNGNYVTVSVSGGNNDESTGFYGFQVNNKNLSQPAVKLWQNTDLGLRWLVIHPFSECVNGNYYFGGERNGIYRSSYRCNMATGEVLFTDDIQVWRTFAPVLYANGSYYGACRIEELGEFCIARASQYYNNTALNTQQLSTPDMISWKPASAFDFGKKRSVIMAVVGQLYYPVFLNNAEIDLSVQGLLSNAVFKYKNKSYMLRNDFRQLDEINDISYLFDDKYVVLPFFN